nr:MAG TPA: hypothetical protein [Caudoviricetes sp.]DAN68656.1 MAG TPA: hypothetical protein [Caudoviricetes sp.]DAZ67164.1 MAG TPA: hypothetical protein [Caudoviricetes sp.]
MQLLNHFKILGAVCPTLMRLILNERSQAR